MVTIKRREKMFDAATSEVTQFVLEHLDYSLDVEQPRMLEYQINGGGTNFVLWGRHRNVPVIFKFFHPDWGAARWRNERACLLHFAPSGWVPAIHAEVPETLIVMDCLVGRFIGDEATSGELDAPDLANLGREQLAGCFHFARVEPQSHCIRVFQHPANQGRVC